MGITPKDIAAQRAIIERGEEKRKRLRDKFAAAALTGLLSNIPRYQLGVIAVQAYDIADEMICERSRTGKNVAETVPEVEKCTEREKDHDAVPEARARDADRGRNDKAVTRPGDGTGNTPSPESYDKSDEKWVNTSTHRGIDRAAYEGDIVSRLRNWRGLHLAHGGKLFDEAADEIARLRAAIRRLVEQDATLSVQGGSVTVTMDATLTDEEREAVATADAYMSAAGCHNTNVQKTLRGLLERLK